MHGPSSKYKTQIKKPALLVYIQNVTGKQFPHFYYPVLQMEKNCR